MPNLFPYGYCIRIGGNPMERDISVLIGGKAGEGINNTGMVVAHLLNNLGYYTFMYYDYPSLIRGGHNFALVRAADRPLGIHRDTADFVLALNQETITRHKSRFSDKTVVIFNSDVVRETGQGISVKGALQAENAPEIMGNSAMIGAFSKVAGISWDNVVNVFTRHLPKGTQQNLAVARRGYDSAITLLPITTMGNQTRPLITGNEAIGLGLVAGGLRAYISYPMTPSSSLLHFLAENARRFGISVIHPENEISVMLMALGFSYAGTRTAVGTSGGGFCLMTEGLSLAGMAEIPVVLLVSQRTGPSTGLPTYTAQSDLRFILYAGQGEFPRFVVAPGDAGQAYTWSAAAMDIAWNFQIPAFILADKSLSEGVYSFDSQIQPLAMKIAAQEWDGKDPYERFRITESGVSPLAFPATKGAIVKVNGYAHDTAGISTEEADLVQSMTEKRMRKGKSLSAAMAGYETVATGGKIDSETAVICWGSVKGVCSEVCNDMGFRMVQPVVLAPFPSEKIRDALKGVRHLIAVEENATGQLAALLQDAGIPVDWKILHCNGRPLTSPVLQDRLQEVPL